MMVENVSMHGSQSIKVTKAVALELVEAIDRGD